MSIGTGDLWGYDNSVLRRYAEFLYFTQGKDPDTASEDLGFRSVHPLYRMLRLRYVFDAGPSGRETLTLDRPMRRLELLQDVRIAGERDQVFAILGDPAFDPTRTVVLEEEPNPMPAPGGPKGTARILDCSTDHLAVEADLPAPAILLITDAYAEDWKARPLPGSVQQEYDVMPANYCLQGIPLSAGRHRLRLEYAPPAFRIGAWISIASLAAYVALGAWWGSCRCRRKLDGG